MSRTDTHVPAHIAFEGYESSTRRNQQSTGIHWKKFLNTPVQSGYTHNGYTLLGTATAKVTSTIKYALATNESLEALDYNYRAGDTLFRYNSFFAPSNMELFLTGKRLFEVKFNLDNNLISEKRLMLEETMRNLVNGTREDFHPGYSRTWMRNFSTEEKNNWYKRINQNLLNADLKYDMEIDHQEYGVLLVPVNISQSKRGTVYTRNTTVEYGMVTYMIIMSKKKEYSLPHWTEYSLHDINKEPDEIRQAGKHFSRAGSEHWYAQKDHMPRSTRKMQLNKNVSNISGLTEEDLYDIFDMED